MPQYKLTGTLNHTGSVMVQADSLEEAIAIAENGGLPGDFEDFYESNKEIIFTWDHDNDGVTVDGEPLEESEQEASKMKLITKVECHGETSELYDLGAGRYVAETALCGTKRQHDAEFDGNGVKWISNRHYVSGDCIARYGFDKIPGFDRQKHEAARKAQQDEFFAEYLRNDQPPSDEELYEMRAAFGPGVEVVNVITGRRTTT